VSSGTYDAMKWTKSVVLNSGHHGSSTSTSPAFLQAVSPRLAVIEVGAGNTYGHPAQTTLIKLANVGATVYRTDLNGTVTVTSDGVNLQVATQR
jgi:competence protein ComEC